MRALSRLLVPIALIALAGCAQHATQTMGSTSAIGPVTAIHDLKLSAKPVTIQGTMIEKCPISGCWFKVRDSSGVLKVDTNAAGFVVADVPVGSRVMVSGKFVAEPEREISALGMRY